MIGIGTNCATEASSGGALEAWKPSAASLIAMDWAPLIDELAGTAGRPPDGAAGAAVCALATAVVGAEAGLAAHHAVVGLGGPFQGVHFVHRTDTGLNAERQSVLRVDGRAGIPSLDGPAAPDEQERGGLQ